MRMAVSASKSADSAGQVRTTIPESIRSRFAVIRTSVYACYAAMAAVKPRPGTRVRLICLLYGAIRLF